MSFGKNGAKLCHSSNIYIFVSVFDAVTLASVKTHHAINTGQRHGVVATDIKDY